MKNRPFLDASRIHPTIQQKVASFHADIIAEVEQAIGANDLVVVGMKQNPHPRRARKALDQRNIPYKYLEYGTYLGPWRRRNALKMWSGWPTFPMVFHKGVLVGGASELIALLESGEIPG